MRPEFADGAAAITGRTTTSTLCSQSTSDDGTRTRLNRDGARIFLRYSGSGVVARLAVAGTLGSEVD